MDQHVDALARYDEDYYSWAKQQAQLLRQGRLSEADIENLAEEIESVANRDWRVVESRLSVLLQHLLKWQFQPERRGRSWQSTIFVQRMKLDSVLIQSPSLRAQVSNMLPKAYRTARKRAYLETGSPDLPEICPYSAEQVLDEDFLPGA